MPPSGNGRMSLPSFLDTGMRFSSILARSIGAVVLVVAADRLSAQTAPAQLMGKWVMDTTNGADDQGLPKSETLVFSRTASGFRITSTTDEGQGASTSGFDCAPAGATTDLGGGQSMRCTIQITGDSVGYALDLLKGGKTIPTERGRLVVASTGHSLRDQYDALQAPKPPTHHRHIYSLSAP
jgi:hypothetical protein